MECTRLGLSASSFDAADHQRRRFDATGMPKLYLRDSGALEYNRTMADGDRMAEIARAGIT
jgi:hypothetical protein